MAHEILTVAEMAAADAAAVRLGVPSLMLMENAGRAVAEAVARRWPQGRIAILCGPGNNGGDGFVAARHLMTMGREVQVETLGPREALKGDAAAMAGQWTGPVFAISPDNPMADVFVDALFGAGLARPLEGEARRLAEASHRMAGRIASVDLPSGLEGDTGRPLGGAAFRADLTVTFHRRKPAHVLEPGRFSCGEVVVAEIGIPPGATAETCLHENAPSLWLLPEPAPGGHKYDRGHLVVVGGPVHATGAARLAARGGLRAGAGLVTLATPAEALAVNAGHLTTIMLSPFTSADGLAMILSDPRRNAVVIGPALGLDVETRSRVAAVLAVQRPAVLDADALSAFVEAPDALFRQLNKGCVLTPHPGEFARLFPDLDAALDPIGAVRAAAARSGAVVLRKGASTLIAAPDGRMIVNTHGSPHLATAGSGDVLAGIIGALLAQGMAAFPAAAAGAWLHGAAGRLLGRGLIAEDLPEALPRVFAEIGETGSGAGRDPLL